MSYVKFMNFCYSLYRNIFNMPDTSILENIKGLKCYSSQGRKINDVLLSYVEGLAINMSEHSTGNRCDDSVK